MQQSGDGFIMGWIGHSVDANRQRLRDTVWLNVAG